MRPTIFPRLALSYFIALSSNIFAQASTELPLVLNDLKGSPAQSDPEFINEINLYWRNLLKDKKDVPALPPWNSEQLSAVQNSGLEWFAYFIEDPRTDPIRMRKAFQQALMEAKLPETIAKQGEALKNLDFLLSEIEAKMAVWSGTDQPSPYVQTKNGRFVLKSPEVKKVQREVLKRSFLSFFALTEVDAKKYEITKRSAELYKNPTLLVTPRPTIVGESKP